MPNTHASTPPQRSPARWLLDQPAKLAAERVIRATRDRPYFEKWDAFTAGVGEALDISPELTPFLGATVGAGLDLLFDRDLDSGEASRSEGPEKGGVDLESLGQRVRQYCFPEKALDWHSSLNSHGAAIPLGKFREEDGSLHEGVAAALALITLGGLRADPDGRWLPFWQGWVERTVRAQVASCGLDKNLIPPKRSDDSSTLAPYLELAAATDMAAMSTAGLVGFSHRRNELIDPVGAVLPSLSMVVRLAADMAFDPIEPVNCAIYLCAAENGIPLRDARSRLVRAPEEAIDIERRLIRLTYGSLAGFEDRCRRSSPWVAALGRVVREAVLAEIESVESGH